MESTPPTTDGFDPVTGAKNGRPTPGTRDLFPALHGKAICFYGPISEGNFAYDAKTGEQLYSFNDGIRRPGFSPITYSVNGGNTAPPPSDWVRYSPPVGEASGLKRGT
ncbi:MAG: hypothetical protein IPL01_13915 [Acidobacteria bacterium]|nr:hypothetical protein [Acidobacteriota bacterium]